MWLGVGWVVATAVNNVVWALYFWFLLYSISTEEGGKGMEMTGENGEMS